MQIGIVVAALKKHKVASALIAFEVALACAVICNALFLSLERSRTLNLVSGLDESRIATVRISGYDSESSGDLDHRVLAALREISGVESVGSISGVPFGYPGLRAGTFRDQEMQNFGGVVDFYLADQHAFKALNLDVVAGRAPSADEFSEVAEVVPTNSPVLITEQLADHYWPGQSPIGKTVWAFDTQFTVIGVVRNLAISQPGGGEALGTDWSIVVPSLPGPNFSGSYIVRSDASSMSSVVAQFATVVAAVAPDVVFDEEWSRSIIELRERYFRNSSVMIKALFVVIISILGATALGIVGLASYWVDARRRQIGIRRALGARKRDILRYFQIENFLIVLAGGILGCLLAYAFNIVLMGYFEVSRLPLHYGPIGALVLLILGQLAVLGPALRASSISPVAAIRAI